LTKEIAIAMSKRKEDVFSRIYQFIWGFIIASMFLILLFPWISQVAIDNAFTLVNGLTTSISIIIGFGITLVGIMFKELPVDNSEIRYNYFQIAGYFLIPATEIIISYLLLGYGAIEFSIKTSISGFLTALLLVIGTFFGILRKLMPLNKKYSSIKGKNVDNR
jgi:hypothetical protein